MTLPQAMELFEHWRQFPPEAEMLHMLASVYTTWRPQGASVDPNDPAAHRRSLEDRWKAGYLSPADMLRGVNGFAVGERVKPDGLGDWPWLNPTVH